jgi:surfeit locus 1 family protein
MTNDVTTPSLSGRTGKGLAVIALGAFCVLIGMGTWQLQRLAWKEGLIADRQAKLALMPLHISTPLSSKPEAFRRVVVTGRFLHDKEIFVGPRSFRGSPGGHVITPLEYASGEIVFVDRGWVPETRKDPTKRQAAQKRGPVSIVGTASWPRKLNYFEHPNDPSKNQWFRVSPTEMAGSLKLQRVAAYWVVADASPNPGGFPIGGGGIRMPTNNHLQYVMTWYGMALGLLVLSFFYWWQGRR